MEGVTGRDSTVARIALGCSSTPTRLSQWSTMKSNTLNDKRRQKRIERDPNNHDESTAALLNWSHPKETPADALTARQLVELKKGVREALEQGERAITIPGDLHSEHWHHSGIGVSIWMHRSGVVVMSSGKQHIVTDAGTLDNIDTAKGGFFVHPGPAFVSSDEVAEQGSETAEGH